MILYFDSLIIDRPLYKHMVAANDIIRNSCKNYAMPSRLDIAKYTLASYALYAWSHVLIRYELNDPDQPRDLEAYQAFDEYILKLFPKAMIIHERSDSQADFKKSLEIIDGWDDTWIFYSGNNDHPIMAPNFSDINTLVATAERFKAKHEFISIVYSHFSEFLNLPRRSTPFHRQFGRDGYIIQENDLSTVIVRQNGENSGIQIVNKNLLNHWFNSTDFGDRVMYRSEDAREGNITRNQVVVIPKRELCAHFDGYAHTLGSPNEIGLDQVPPLFIPPGFFENAIKIRYGYNTYKEGWTNINPAAKQYSFRDSIHGSDLMWTLDDIPLFWKDRIAEIDANPNRNDAYLKKMRDRKYAYVRDPWKDDYRQKMGYVMEDVVSLPRRIIRKLYRTFLQ